MKPITLTVNGREMTFSEQELIAIVEKHLSSETTQQATIAKVAQKPTEGEWFEVKPQAIDQKLFDKTREDRKQEYARFRIHLAFNEMKKNPGKYGRNFKTMMPKCDWKRKNAGQLKEMACKLGDHNADWVEQALEWAQRIANGESWNSICNAADTAKWYRLVVWDTGYARRVGGSVSNYDNHPASRVGLKEYDDSYAVIDTVPLVVLYEK